jgi:hypothetical protein
MVGPMDAFDYAAAPVPVRGDIPAAHRRAWQRLARPGSWWSGAERVAIATEVRRSADCALCRERKAALSPESPGGEHERASDLPDAVVDVIHRISTDPARLSRAWYEKSLAAGLSDAHYVELVGVLVAVVSIDAFHRGLGLPLEPLPEPEAGEPSRRRPARARIEGAWVPMLPPGAARGEQADLWNPRMTANVLRALSLVPDAVRQLKELSAVHYVRTDQVADVRIGRSLGRAQIELLAGRVSALNECFY